MNQRLPQGNTTQDSSTVPSTSGPPSGTKATIIAEGNAVNPSVNGPTQQPSSDSEGRGKKKTSIQGKVRGIGAVPKGRAPAGPGWTGSGFDVDGRG